jgi:hypothetical protein
MKYKCKTITYCLRDDYGNPVRAGDSVAFTYGIPPIHVVSKIAQRDGRLIGLIPGHNPPEFNLRSLRRFAGWWCKYEGGGA